MLDTSNPIQSNRENLLSIHFLLPITLPHSFIKSSNSSSQIQSHWFGWFCEMGCANSKKHQVCRNCQAPVSRTYSMHVHHPPQHGADTYHLVALTSTTLGYNLQFNDSPVVDKTTKIDDDKDFSMGMIEAKSWSKMIDQKIPKVVPRTPVQTPPGEPEKIDACELMKGLEDSSPLHQHFRSFSFSVNRDSVDLPTPRVEENGPKPIWNESESNSKSIDFDPDIITQFRKSLEELPLANPFHLKPMVADGIVKNLNGYNKDDERFGKEKVVLYFTSLRGVRKTYEDCCHVRVILKGLNLKVDERDVSMHSGFKEELKELLGDRWFNGGGLPRVFVGKKYIGGGEEIRRMNGQLEKLLEGCEKEGDDGGGGPRPSVGGAVCDACGDVRFVPCETCSGSCKIYYEPEYDEDENEEAEFGFQRCPDCNENGLIRCPLCCCT